MKTIALILSLVFFKVSCSYSQNIENFESDLQLLADRHFSDGGIDTLFNKYNQLLFWFEENARQSALLQGKKLYDRYPLSEFKNKAVYKNHIDSLLLNNGQKQQLLGCFLAGAVGDNSKIGMIRDLVIKSNYKQNWAAVILVCLGTNDLRPIVQSILKSETPESANYLVQQLMNVEPTVLSKFGQDSLYSKNPNVQYIALKSLARTAATPEKITLVTNYIKKSEVNLKGWGLALLAQYRAGNIWPLVKDHINDKRLRAVGLKALTRSSSKEDIVAIKEMVRDEVPDKALLSALLESKNSSYVKDWLALFEEKRIPGDYYFTINGNKELKDDSNFDIVCRIIDQGDYPLQLSVLVSYFEGRKDEKTIFFLNKLLTHHFSDIREAAARLLKRAYQ